MNTILLYIRDIKISITQEKYLAEWNEPIPGKQRKLYLTVAGIWTRNLYDQDFETSYFTCQMDIS